MKRNVTLIVLIFSAILIFTACSSNSSNENNTNAVEDSQENSSNNDIQQGQNNDVAQTNDSESTDSPLPIVENNESGGTRLAGSIFTVAELEGGLEIGASQEEVSIFFDSHPYHEVTASYDGRDVWRYDIGAQSDYSFESEADLHDQEGILNGSVPIQMFIYFNDEGIVNGYTVYQAGEGDSITVYQTLGDGTRKVETIE